MAHSYTASLVVMKCNLWTTQLIPSKIRNKNTGTELYNVKLVDSAHLSMKILCSSESQISILGIVIHLRVLTIQYK